MCSCHPLPSAHTSAPADEGTDPTLSILRKCLWKQTAGQTTRVLLPALALPAPNAETKHIKTGLTFGIDFLSAVFHICPDTFPVEDSQTDNEIPGFSETWAPGAQHQKCQFQLCRSRLQNVQLSYHGKKCFWMQFLITTTSFLACFQTGTFGFMHYFWKYFILLIPSLPLYVRHWTAIGFKQLLIFLINVTVKIQQASHTPLLNTHKRF